MNLFVARAGPRCALTLNCRREPDEGKGSQAFSILRLPYGWPIERSPACRYSSCYPTDPLPPATVAMSVTMCYASNEGGAIVAATDRCERPLAYCSLRTTRRSDEGYRTSVQRGAGLAGEGIDSRLLSYNRCKWC